MKTQMNIKAGQKGFNHNETQVRHRRVRGGVLRTMTAALLLVCMSVAGCDSFDPNAATNAPQETTSFASKSAQDDGFIGPPEIEPTLVGTWVYVDGTASEARTVTFKGNMRVRVQTTCGIYKGDYAVPSQGQLTISELELRHQTCSSFVQDPLIAGLEATTGYKFGEGQLYITSEAHEEPLVFRPVNDGNDGIGIDADDGISTPVASVSLTGAEFGSWKLKLKREFLTESGTRKIKLKWNPAEVSKGKVDFYVGGVHVERTQNDGRHTLKIFDVTEHVLVIHGCAKKSTRQCSNPVFAGLSDDA